ncbi:MAG: sigma-54-dependent Fis family transcriptional regulator [Planctomycetes bacterium]|nr:sigma-54-dependent Fis family transcriptional regulator [Planctomycetota bacterium]
MAANTTTHRDTPTAQVLIVDDEVEHAQVMADALRRPGHVCTIRHGLADAVAELEGGQFDVVVTDLIMKNEPQGMEILEQARRLQPTAKAIMVTAHGDIPTAKEAIRKGAYDFIEKPLDLDVFRNLVNRAAETVLLTQQNRNLREQLHDKYGFEGIIGASTPIREIISVLQQVAPTDIPVLIRGETGSGKELVARALHNASLRAGSHFKPVNCAAFTESLLESQLFGHVKGAFTGADKPVEGVFEYANSGTLFLDEIGDMPLSMQSKLLRVLESGEVVRVGSNEPKTVDVRLVSATHRDLEDMVKAGDFRQDLFFRVKGVEIRIPPLRERREDIPLLVQHTIDQQADQAGKTIPGVDEDAMRILITFDWPGNVRQLMSVVRNMVVFCPDGENLSAEHVPEDCRRGADAEAATDAGGRSLAGMDLAELEKRAIRETLKLTDGNREQAARMLGIGERTLYRKLKEFGLR